MKSKIILGLLLICMLATAQAATTYQLVYTVTKVFTDNDDGSSNNSVNNSLFAANGSSIANIGQVVNDITIKNSTK
ncbi:unnamed protein product, partial [Brenthis ino]